MLCAVSANKGGGFIKRREAALGSWGWGQVRVGEGWGAKREGKEAGRARGECAEGVGCVWGG